MSELAEQLVAAIRAQAVERGQLNDVYAVRAVDDILSEGVQVYGIKLADAKAIAEALNELRRMGFNPNDKHTVLALRACQFVAAMHDREPT